MLTYRYHSILLDITKDTQKYIYIYICNTYHNCSASGIDGQILARNDPSTAAFAKSLLMHLVEHVLGGNVLQNYYPSRIRAHDDIILRRTSQPECRQGPDDAEDLNSQQSMNLSCVGIRSQQFQRLSARDQDLLHFTAGEISMDRVCDAGGAL